MRTTLVAGAMLLAVANTAAAGRCDRPEQPPGTGNSLLTWRIPKGCPLSAEERRTRDWCRTLPPAIDRDHVGGTAYNENLSVVASVRSPPLLGNGAAAVLGEAPPF